MRANAKIVGSQRIAPIVAAAALALSSVRVVGVASGLNRTQGRDYCQILTHINFAGGE
jgi:hypothetical protein